MKPIDKITIFADSIKVGTGHGVSVDCEGLSVDEIIDVLKVEDIFQRLGDIGKLKAKKYWNLEEVKKSKKDYYLLQLTKEILSRDVSLAIKVEALEGVFRLVENNKVRRAGPGYYLINSFDWKETKEGYQFWNSLYYARQKKGGIDG